MEFILVSVTSTLERLELNGEQIVVKSAGILCTSGVKSIGGEADCKVSCAV